MEGSGRIPIVVGLVGAAGTNLNKVIKVLTGEFKRAGYRSKTIRLSDKLLDFGERGTRLLGRQARLPFDELMTDLQTAGDKLRETTGRNDAMAMFAIGDILPDLALDTAFLVRSFKTKEEVDTMRTVFGRGFVLVAAYSPKDTRRDEMEREIARSRKTREYKVGGKYRAAAQKIIRRDEREFIPFGQNVRHAFPLADVFIDASAPKTLGAEMRRFVDLLFKSPELTPTKEEQAMFMAQAARLRSSSLHRQVGAALATAKGEIVALGCNDVPKPFGGLYWPGDPNDSRDFKLKRDISQERKVDLVHEMLIKLDSQESLAKPVSAQLKKDGPRLAKDVLDSLRKTRVSDLIEFFRTTHAEMEALLSAARRGVSVQDTLLYTTTFPCHECTRHIVTAGIRRVIFIDPYEKSLGHDLHFDSIVVDQPKIEDRVRFDPFVGVGPRVYRELFDWRRSPDMPPDEEFDPSGHSPVFGVEIDAENLVLAQERLAKKANLKAFLETLVSARLVKKPEETHIRSTSKHIS